jgi:hypothetical protein
MNLGYIDPGTGSMLISAILGGLAAIGVFLRMYWNRLLTLLRIRKPEALERTGEPVPRR